MMKKWFFAPALLIAASVCFGAEASLTPRYWFDRPAAIWEESIPLGNGRVGMMPWGGVRSERIVLNEISLWSGGPQMADNPDALQYLPEIRRLLFEGRGKEAQDLMYKAFTCLGRGSSGPEYGCFQTFGDLWLDFEGMEDEPVGNRRELDLSTAESRTHFSVGGVSHDRRYFVSQADDVGVIRLTSSENNLDFTVRFERAEGLYDVQASGGELTFRGELEAGPGQKGMHWHGRVRAILPGVGTVEAAGGKLTVRGADEVLLVVSLATDYAGLPEYPPLADFDGGDPAEKTAAIIERRRAKAASADYNAASPVMRGTLSKVVNEDLRRFMPSISAPTLLVWGEKDTATPLRDAKIMERLIPDAGLVVFPGAGHYSFLERPAQFAAVLDSFLGS